MSDWTTDLLGKRYEQRRIELGEDPDGEPTISATLVRRKKKKKKLPRAAILYVHGFTDYFFQTEMAEFYIKRGIAFYALDLRKCGRSLGESHTPHYVSDLALYDTELDEALSIVQAETRGEHGPVPVLLSGHSTGGLVVPLWLHRRNSVAGGTRGDGIAGVILNSPWFDLQGPPLGRSVGTWAIAGLAKLKPLAALPLPEGNAYPHSLHVSLAGEWDFNTAWKPLDGFDVTLGWMAAIRAGHAVLHRGLDIGVPSLVLRSAESHITVKYSDKVERADCVLDVRQIARWSGCLGDAVTSVPIQGAKHDVFLSRPDAREAAYAVTDRWLKSVL